jgi:hypothetical protein
LDFIISLPTDRPTTNATLSNSSLKEEGDIKQEVVLLSDMEDERGDGEEVDDPRLGGYGDDGTFGGGGFDNFGYEYSDKSGRQVPLSAPVRFNAGCASSKSDSADGLFHCPLCFRRYKTAGSLQNHRSLYHRNEIGKQSKPVAAGGLAGHAEFPDPDEWHPAH